MPTDLSAPITSVTVYTDRARVTRSNEIELSKGETVLVLSGLPANMDRDSVRVSGKGAGITIRGVDVKRDVQESSESSKSLRNQLKKLQREIDALDHQMQTYDEQLAYYRALKTQASKESGLALLTEDTSFERVTQVANYIRNEMQNIFDLQRGLLAQKEDLQEQVETVQFRLAEGDTNIQAGQAVHIAVDAEQDMTFTYEIDYLVYGAFWKPLYDVRLLNDNDVELTYMAQVTQETGEDWEDVNLSLSTARPALSNQLPEAKAWYVTNRNPYRLSSPAMPNQTLAGNTDGYAYDLVQPAPTYAEVLLERSRGFSLPSISLPTPQPKEAKAEIQQAVIESSSSGAVVTYKIGTPITVVGNGEPHKTTITVTGLKAALDYVTVPRIAQEAYLRATITNNSDYTILPGEASIFHENDFVGKTTLETISPTEEFEVQLGVDDRIKIERELITRDTSKSMIGTKQQIYYRYAVNITNLLQKPTKISVQDQYPLSHTSDVKVKLESASPQAEEESDLHVLKWEIDLPDDKKRTIELAFTIEYGRNQSVYGLDD